MPPLPLAVSSRLLSTPTTPPALAVIIPTLEERDNVAPLLADLDAALAGLAWEAIFVDDGSADGTVEAITAIARTRGDIRLIRRFGRRGLSSAVIEGMMATTAPVVAVIDADRQHDETILPALYDAVAGGETDIAVGTRYCAGGSVGAISGRRASISRFATRLATLATATPLSDPMSGYFVVRQAAVVAALPRMSSVGFKVLLDLMLSSPQPLRVCELPYRFRRRTAGASKLDSLVAVQFALLLIEKLTGRWVPPRFVLFATVGAVGLAVHLAVLSVLMDHADLPFHDGQAIAVTLTIAFNFALNNAFTYRDRRLRGARMLRGLASFYLVCGIGALGNIGIGDLVYDADRRWWLAGIVGATMGAVWNYAASSFLTWKRA